MEQISEMQSQANYYYDFAPWTKIFLDSALALAKHEHLPREEAVAVFNLMQYYVFNSMPDSTLARYEEGMAMPAVQEDPGLKSDFYAQLATLYKRQGNAKAAIQNFANALSLLEKPGYLESQQDEKALTDVQRSLVIIYNNLANLYQDIDDYAPAHEAYGKAFQLLVAMEEPAIAGTVWMNKGSIYLKEQKFDSAYVVQKEAMQLKRQGNASQRSLAMSNLNVGNALLGLGRLDAAQEQLDSALDIFVDIDNESGLANALIDRGQLNLAKKLFERARGDCERGKTLSHKVGRLDFQANACECLYEAHKALGNFQRALENHEDLKTLHDSLRNDENTRYITQLEMQYEFDRAEETRLAEAEVARLVQVEKDRRTRRILMLLSALLLFAVIVAYLWFRNFQIKKKSETTLTAKNEIISKALAEKQLLLKEIHHRVKNNLQVISSLLRLQSRYIEDDAALDALSAGRSRVQSMALLHENLYQEDNLKGVDMQAYFDKLIDGLFRSLNTDEEHITLVKEVAPISLDIDSVVPIGLITNELITNALKHAFSDQEKGELVVRLYEVDQKLHLEVQDNGKGMPADFFDSKVTSFGHKLIKAFVANLGA